MTGVGDDLKYKVLSAQLRATSTAVIYAFNHLLDLKDFNTGVHSTRLAEWSVRVSRELGLEDPSVDDVEIAAMLHDIGKIGVPDQVLRKPGPLTPEERTLMQRHSEYGWAALRGIPGFERASLLVLHHHESYDGTGYPSRLRGDEIPLGGRIVSIIDAFDAMTSPRPYRAPLAVEEAIRRLEAASGTQFDPVVVPAFVRIAQSELASVIHVTCSDIAFAM
jgi:ribonuclease P protein subunit RPR2